MKGPIGAVPAVFRRRRGDPLSTAPAPVLLVPLQGSANTEARERAVAAAREAGGPVAVVALLKIYGSSFGFPNPGLLPTAQEKDAARQLVERTIGALERSGVEADGQITATRHPAKVIAAAAHRRQAQWVIIDQTGMTSSGLRRLIEGDLAASVRRRLANAARVEVVS